MISFKKVGSIIAIALVLVLCIPSVPALAAYDDIKIKTFNSVDGFYADTELNNAQRFVTNYNPKNSISYPSLSTLYGYLEDYQWDSTKDSYVVFFSRYSDTLIVWQFDTTKAVDPFLVVKNSTFNLPQDGNTTYDFFLFFNSTVSDQYVVRAGELSLNASSPTWVYNDARYVGSSGIKIYDNTQEQLLDANIPCYLNWDIVRNGGSAVSTSSSAFFNADKSSYTNFLSPDLPYMDSDGAIVTPSGGDPEVNSHFGFRKFDSQVVMQSTYSKDASYQALLTWETDPVGGDFVTGNAEDWKLHLDCTVNYTVGQYPDGNVLVPEQQSTGSIVFGGDLQFDNLDRYKAGDWLIDPMDTADHLSSPYCTMSDGSGAFFVALLAGMKGDVASGNKAIERYGLLGTTLEAVGSTVSTVAGSWIISAFNELTGTSIPNFLDQYLNTDYYYAVDAYSINIKGYLVGPSVQSQYGVANSDFVTFTSSGYAQPVTPEATESVPDPQPQQPYQQTNLPAVTPTGYDSQGNMTYVVVNIDNTDNVPSIDGNNNMSYNPTFSPSVNNSTNIDLGIDNVADTLDPLVVQENQSFWNLFNPFKDNAFIEATEDYMGIIPSQLQTIFISSFGILIGLTVYRFIRRG